ncbi:transposase [Shewanella sp. A14]
MSSAYFNEVGNGANDRRGRDVSASFGIAPKQHSSGGKDILLGISKRGNSYTNPIKYVIFQREFKVL